jgi:MscS family membrane protein
MLLHHKAMLTVDYTDDQLIIFFRDLLKALIWILGILLVLKYSLGFPLSNVFTGLSIVGAALALAFRESLENLIASFIIFFDKPFITGDLVKVNNFTGTIERIGLRSTRIRTTDKTYISVPNKQMVDTIVDNITLRTQRKAEMRLELDLGATAGQVRELVAALKNVLQKPGIESQLVYFTETGKNAHVVSVEYYTNMQQSIEEFNELREAINLEIIDLLAANKLELAASNKEVVLKTVTPP